MKDLVIFDFCETLVDFQTADRFISFILEDTTIKKNKFWIITSKLLGIRPLSLVFNKFFPTYNYSKRVKLLRIRGVKKDDIHKASIDFQEELDKHLILPLNKLLNKYLKQEDHVIVVSGGYEPYIKVFVKRMGIKQIFATKIKINDNFCMGIFDGKDCMHEQKRILVEDYVRNHNLEYKRSFCFTDSMSDLPIMQWVDEGIVVSKNKSQGWTKQYGFKEIIWKK